jgi:hypothetical protein
MLKDGIKAIANIIKKIIILFENKVKIEWYLIKYKSNIFLVNLF